MRNETVIRCTQMYTCWSFSGAYCRIWFDTWFAYAHTQQLAKHMFTQLVAMKWRRLLSLKCDRQSAEFVIKFWPNTNGTIGSVGFPVRTMPFLHKNQQVVNSSSKFHHWTKRNSVHSFAFSCVRLQRFWIRYEKREHSNGLNQWCKKTMMLIKILYRMVEIPENGQWKKFIFTTGCIAWCVLCQSLWISQFHALYSQPFWTTNTMRSYS